MSHATRHSPLALSTRIRWVIRRDMPEILEIERECFGADAWDEDDFILCLRQRNAIGMVIESPDDQIVGYMVYELSKAALRILNFAVAPRCRRQGVGTRLVETLKAKLSWSRRTSIVLEIREANLVGQLFFRSCGFRATGVASGFYRTSEDAYVMRYRLQTF